MLLWREFRFAAFSETARITAHFAGYRHHVVVIMSEQNVRMLKKMQEITADKFDGINGNSRKCYAVLQNVASIVVNGIVHRALHKYHWEVKSAMAA